MKIPRPSPGYFLLIVLLLLACGVNPAAGQYIYIDTDGDGDHDASDVLSAAGPTTVAIWLETNHNRNGAAAVCANGSGPLDIFSYEFILRASGGAVTWGPYTDTMAFPFDFGVGSSSSDFFVTRGGSPITAPGRYQLGSVTVDVNSGTPVLEFARSTLLRPATGTRFGSNCTGVNFNNTIELGVDFFDADGSAPVFTALVGTTGSQDIINFQANNWTQRCIEIKANAGSFNLTDIDVSSIQMVSPGTGNVNAVPCKNSGIINTSTGTLTVCFTRSELLKLFCYVAGSNNLITVKVIGNLYGGGSFSGTVTLKVSFGTINCVARLWPNPLAKESVIELRTYQPGFIRVSIYDVQGRLVRRLLDEPDALAGDRRVPVRGLDATGQRLASGIYFYKVEVPGGSVGGRFAVLK